MPDWYNECIKVYLVLYDEGICGNETINRDWFFELCDKLYNSELEDKFGKPMLWIGMYIAAASLLCTLAMAADLFHGFRNKRLWFPCKYFTLNAASLMVITVAMKLPVDLSNPMPSTTDKLAYMGSMVFMCTMMVNIMPSLASMSNKELLTNFIALAILVVTISVNVCIEIRSGVASTLSASLDDSYYDNFSVRLLTIIYVVLLLLLLVILISSVLAIPTSKGILESKYKATHKVASDEQESWERAGIFNVEKIRQHVGRYWVMAGTGNPQFVMATSPTCSASGVICVSMAAFHLFIVILTTYLHIGNIVMYEKNWHTNSVYGWSTAVILVIQAIGVLVGNIAPLFRCFSALSFQLSRKWSKNHVKVNRVELYWTQKLSDWKLIRLPIPNAGRRFKLLVHHLKNLILSSCILLQKAVVVGCKAVGLLPIFVVIVYTYCFHGYRDLKKLFGEHIASNTDPVPEVIGHEGTGQDLSRYVLQLTDEVRLAERTLKGISKSLNRLIGKSEKQKPKNLSKFLESPILFEGVEQLSSNLPSILLLDEPQNSWSLTVVSLTSIMISIPDIPKDKVDHLLKIVDEGLAYASIVEESINSTNDSLKFQRAAKKLWPEVEVYNKWLNHNLQGGDFNEKTLKETMKLLMDRANGIMVKLQGDNDEPADEISLDRLIAASMSRITSAILHSLECIPQPVGEKQLFMQLSTMIADVLRACFTHLPQVIAMKCYASSIEKREESIKAAAQLLGQTKELMEKVHGVEILSIDPDQTGIC